MVGYDIIGDVHGCGTELEQLLGVMGYERDARGTFRHPTRTAIFVGDLIDRGDEQAIVLDIVRSMVEERAAAVVMGNHEFNAICYATPDPRRPGTFLRAHTPAHDAQHDAFLQQVGNDADRYSEAIAWFKTLPIWLELDGGLRVVHACWNDSSIALLERAVHPGMPLSEEFLVGACEKGTPIHDAVEILLKGPELELDDYGLPPFRDKEGKERRQARTRWWRHDATTIDQFVELPSAPATQTPVAANDRAVRYDPGAPLVVFGHYWQTGDPRTASTNAVCVDYSAVKGGPLVAFRFNGNGQPNSFVDHQGRRVEVDRTSTRR